MQTTCAHDDLQKIWGTEYIHTGKSRTVNSITIKDNQLINALNPLLPKGFKLLIYTGTGTATNAHAISDACQMHNTQYLIGIGTYVAGDRSHLHALSSSTFSPNDYLGRIASPWELYNRADRHVMNRNILTHPIFTVTIPLPYFIPPQDQNVIQLEKICLDELERRLLLNALRHKGFRSLFLEIVLATNGAELSAEFLAKLGTLFLKYRIAIIVDNILTGGRCDSHILTVNAPKEFINAVTHITMGKWITIGLVLFNQCNEYKFDHWKNKRDFIQSRGGSSF